MNLHHENFIFQSEIHNDLSIELVNRSLVDSKPDVLCLLASRLLVPLGRDTQFVVHDKKLTSLISLKAQSKNFDHGTVINLDVDLPFRVLIGIAPRTKVRREDFYKSLLKILFECLRTGLKDKQIVTFEAINSQVFFGIPRFQMAEFICNTCWFFGQKYKPTGAIRFCSTSMSIIGAYKQVFTRRFSEFSKVSNGTLSISNVSANHFMFNYNQEDQEYITSYRNYLRELYEQSQYNREFDLFEVFVALENCFSQQNQFVSLNQIRKYMMRLHHVSNVQFSQLVKQRSIVCREYISKVIEKHKCDPNSGGLLNILGLQDDTEPTTLSTPSTILSATASIPESIVPSLPSDIPPCPPFLPKSIAPSLPSDIPPPPPSIPESIVPSLPSDIPSAPSVPKSIVPSLPSGIPPPPPSVPKSIIPSLPSDIPPTPPSVPKSIIPSLPSGIPPPPPSVPKSIIPSLPSDIPPPPPSVPKSITPSLPSSTPPPRPSVAVLSPFSNYQRPVSRSTMMLQYPPSLPSFPSQPISVVLPYGSKTKNLPPINHLPFSKEILFKVLQEFIDADPSLLTPAELTIFNKVFTSRDECEQDRLGHSQRNLVSYEMRQELHGMPDLDHRMQMSKLIAASIPLAPPASGESTITSLTYVPANSDTKTDLQMSKFEKRIQAMAGPSDVDRNQDSSSRFDQFSPVIKFLGLPPMSSNNWKYIPCFMLKYHSRIIEAMFELIPSSELDRLSLSLVHMYYSMNRVMALICTAIECEVANTSTVATLFRQNSLASKIMSLFARMISKDYLCIVLTPTIERIKKFPDTLEVDPTKLKDPSQLASNQKKLTEVTNLFIQDILNSMPQLPMYCRFIIKNLREIVETKFPDGSSTGIAGFLILRLLNPALVTPDATDLLICTIKGREHMRRTLILVSKILQNIANQVEFKKEQFMLIFNDFVNEKLPLFEDFLLKCAYVDSSNFTSRPAHSTAKNWFDSLNILYQFFQINEEKINDLLSAGQEFSSEYKMVISHPPEKYQDVESNIERHTSRGVLAMELGPNDRHSSRPTRKDHASISPWHSKFQRLSLRPKKEGSSQ